MKRLLATAMGAVFFSLIAMAKPDLRDAFEFGSPNIESIHAITFGPEGILFIGDSKSATIFALDTKDVISNVDAKDIDVKNIDELISKALGTEVDNIVIQDMAINPISKRIYIAVHHVDGTPVLITVEDGNMGHFDFSEISYSKVALNHAVAVDSKDRRGRSLRKWAISDLDYFDGKVLVSGLSNKEFSSAMTMIPFPFNQGEELATLEIWHAAHGKFETHSPVKTFTTANINGEAFIVASYTCTPLVLFPLNSLKPGQHVKGRTVAELGNRNTPLDIISMEKDGKSYILLANSSRALMKISYEKLAAFSDDLTEPVPGNSETAGVDFISLPLVNVLQLDKLDEDRFVMLQRRSNGDLDLYSNSGRRWL